MKVATLLTLAAGALAQNVMITAPPVDAQLKAGSDVVVMVTRPGFQSSAVEIGIAIGLQPCPDGDCYDPRGVLGWDLYAGPYNPAHSDVPPNFTPHQNFTVTIPDDTPKGHAILAVAHANLIGAMNGPNMQVVAQNVTIV